MTADVAHREYVYKKQAPPYIAEPEARLELTRDQGFLNGTRDIFDILARHGGGKETAGDEGNALPERTRAMLRQVEKTIREQDRRLKELEDCSGIDALTGLLNGRGFARAFAAEVARTNRGYSEGGLLVIFSLENLEAIRARHGGYAADAALGLIARAVEAETRAMDHAARIRGDEFVLLFAETTMEKALDRLQAMALRLNRISLVRDGGEIRLNLSLGLKSYAKGVRAEDVFTAASADLERNRKSAAQEKTA